MAERSEVQIVNEALPVAINYQNRAGRDVQPAVEDDGAARNYTLLVGERIYLDGTTEPEEVVLRANPDHQLQVEVVSRVVYVAPQAVTGSMTSMWLPGTTSSDIYEVEATFMAQSDSQVEIICGVDISNGGTLAATEYLIFDVPIPGNQSLTLPPFRMTGADDFMAISTGGVGANLYLKVNQIV